MFIPRFWQSRLAVLLLPSSLVVLLPQPAFGQVAVMSKAPDLQGHWAQSCLQTLAQRGILAPYADGTFRPNEPVSRSDYATTIQRAFPQQRQTERSLRFRDIQAHPAAGAIQYMQQTGFWLNEGRDEFKPGQAITRSQAFGGLANGLRYTVNQSAAKDLRAAFKDGRQVPDFTRNAVAAALENRLIINYPDAKRLNPNQPLRRSEFAASLCQAMPNLNAAVPQQYVASLGTPVAVTPKPSIVPTPPRNPGSVVVPVVSIDGGSSPVTNPPIGLPPVSVDPVAPPPKIPTQEIRGAWITNIDSNVLFSSRLLQEAMQDLARLNFNTVYPVVWNWGYTQYPSQVARRTLGSAIDPRIPGLQNRDPLAEFVQHGRQQRIAVIPWFEFGFMAPADSELVKRHPDWLTQRQDGSKIWQEGEYQRVWLNPFKPEVQQFMLDLILEVAAYDVDGIQFDDHMGLPSDFGYDPETIALYQKDNPGKQPPVNSKDPAWLRWRADKITQFMGRVHRAIKARKPNLIVGLSPNSQKFAYENYLQDWQTWRRQGYIEELVLQVYRSNLDSFIVELLQPEVQEARQHIPVGVGVLTGLKGKPMPIAQVQEQIQAARNLGFAGVSFFFYETMWNLSNEPGEYRKSGFQTIFAPTVTRPSLQQGWRPEP